MFDDARLDDPAALDEADPQLRHLAESGARVRRELDGAGDWLQSLENVGLPRAVIVAGRDASRVHAVLEPSCVLPLLGRSWPGLPGWAGPLDTVAVAASDPGDETALSAIGEAVRRDCTLVVVCPAGSAVARAAEGRHSWVLPIGCDDPVAAVVLLLAALQRMGLATHTGVEQASDALDRVAVACSPFADAATNPAKDLAATVGDSTALLWGTSALAAHAARRSAYRIAGSTGSPALAAAAAHLVPLIKATPPRDLFADPFQDSPVPVRSSVLVFDDGAAEDVTAGERDRLAQACADYDVPIEQVVGESGPPVPRYVSLLATGHYVATYLGVALGHEVTGG